MIQREKSEISSNFLMFMEERVKLVLGQIVLARLKKLECQIDQLFFVTNVKNNKLTKIYWTYIQV